eukprot:6868090-Alexandrium_andersonii.AAC.1
MDCRLPYSALLGTWPLPGGLLAPTPPEAPPVQSQARSVTTIGFSVQNDAEHRLRWVDFEALYGFRSGGG